MDRSVTCAFRSMPWWTIAFLFCCLSVLAQNSPQEQKPTGPTPPPLPQPQLRALYAPVVRTADLPDGELTLNNRAPHTMHVTMVVHDAEGNSYELPAVTLNSHEVRLIRVTDLLPDMWKSRQDLGGLSVNYIGQPNEVATQFTLFSRNRLGSVDETLRLAEEYRSHRLNSVWYMPAGCRARIAIGNSSSEEVTMTTIDYAGRFREIKLAPLATRFIEIPPSSHRKDEASAGSLSVISQAPAGVVQAVGYVTSPENGTNTIRFYDPETMRSADLFATNLPIANRDVRLVLRNMGMQPLTARVLFRSATTGVPFTDIPPIQLMTGEARVVDTSTLMTQGAKDQDFQSVSAQIASNGPNGSLVGALSAYDPATHLTFELPLRDRGSLKTSSGGYPVRLEGDYTTNVSITNVTDEPAKFMAVIRHKEGDWVVPERSLEPGETALFDIRRLRDDRVKDPNGAKLPRDMKIAQFNWTMVGGGSTPRLIGRSHISSTSRGVSASYSCWICCPANGPFYDPNPSIFTFAPGESGHSSTTYTNIDCYGNQGHYNTVLTYTDEDASIAYTSTDSQYTWVHGVSRGCTDFCVSASSSIMERNRWRLTRN